MSSIRTDVPTPPSGRGAGLGTAGFTFVEILIALLISSIFAGIVFQLMRGQSTFVAVQNARGEVQQNSRGALEIVTAELRAATSAGLVDAGTHALTFRVPRAWGIICDNPTASEIHAVFPVQSDVLIATVGATTGITVDVGTLPADVATAYTPDYQSTGTVTAIAAIPLVGSRCNAQSLGGVSQVYRITGSGFPVPASAYQPIAVHDVIRYDVGESDGMQWVRRTFGNASQPLAGPLPDATSLSFTYRDGVGATVPAPGTLASSAGIERVQVRVTTRSRSKMAGEYQFQTDSMTVFLRN